VQATAAHLGMRDAWLPADHGAGRQAGRPSEEPAAGEATVGPARLNRAIISIHHSVLASWRSTTPAASLDREVPTL
jgi:hypothetical protein